MTHGPVQSGSTRNATAATPLDLGFDPAKPAFIADPYPVYRRLRREQPVVWNPSTGQWLVSRHADVNRLLRDRLGRTYLHAATHAEMGRADPPAWQAPFRELNDAGMLDMEPPDHTRIRRLVSKAFTPRTVEGMRERIQVVVNGLVEAILDRGEADLIADYVASLPVAVIAELLGIPEADRHLLRPWSADFCLMYEVDPPPEAAQRAVRASVEFGAYLRDLLADLRAHPQDGLISSLAAVVDDGEALTEAELIGTCVLLLNAGHEASVNGATNSWWTLFRHPAALARLRAEPSILPTAIEELLRYDTPLSLFERWVLEPIEIDGIAIPRGSEVALLFGSANRDPDVFADPDRLDLARDPNPCLSFGAGIHYCLGAPLAKLELGIAFETLLRRAPRLELVEEPPSGSPRSCCVRSSRSWFGSERMRYVALGDSYTIGTSVPREMRWPDQLVAALAARPTTLDLVANLGVNGYTSGDLIRDELSALDDLRPEFVTVLIGVNDVVQGVPAPAYEANVMTILDDLLGRVAANRIVAVATPDYTVTPAGADFGDPRRQHDGIVAVNGVLSRLAGARGIAFVDIFDLSRNAATDRSLVADDGLHPSAAQYARWVERIGPVVAGLLDG